MSKFPNGIRLIIKGFPRIALRVYYRSIQVQGRELFPEQGPVLLIANHPNSLVDPAVLVDLLSQPIYFGANHKLFPSRMRSLCCVPSSPTANAGKPLSAPSLTTKNPMSSSSTSSPTIVWFALNWSSSYSFSWTWMKGQGRLQILGCWIHRHSKAIPLHLLAQTLKAPLSMPLVSRKRSEFQQES